MNIPVDTHLASDATPPARTRLHSIRALAAAGFSLVAIGVAQSRADLLYATYSTNQIEKFTAGGVASLFANTGSSSQPEGLAFDNAGNLFVANFGFNTNTIARFTPGGVGSTFATASTGVSRPVGLAFDSAGNLYAANAGSNTIEKFNITTGVGSVFASTGLSGPIGLAFDSAGNLFVSNQGNNTIEKFTIGGVGSLFATVSTFANSLAGLAFDRTGNLYVADVNANKINKFTIGGVASVFASTGLNQPIGLAFDSVGNLYAANQGNATIEKFTTSGVGSVFANTTANGALAPQYLAFTDNAGRPLPLANQLGAIPEPSTWLTGIALCAATLVTRRRGRA